jgi:hypothetical protein
MSVVDLPPEVPPPPRTLDTPTRVGVLFGGVVNTLGWIFLAVGLLLAVLLLRGVDLSAYTLGDVPTVPLEGELLAKEWTDWSEGPRSKRKGIHRYRFAFTGADGERYEGESFLPAPGPDLEPGARVSLLVPEGMPEAAVIEGMRRSPLSPVILWLLSIPILAVMALLVGVTQAKGKLRILRLGVEAGGEVLSTEPTAVRLNNRTVMKATVQFDTQEGRRVKVVFRTTDPAAAQGVDGARLLYDPGRPERALLLSDLPAGVAATPEGLRATRPGVAYGMATLAGLTLAGWGVFLATWLR